MHEIELWNRDKTEYCRHRIPGMIVTSKGTLLAYNESRFEGNDWARMDILLSRSTDGGKTFGEPICLARGSEEIPTVNNPVMVEDNAGALHFLYCENYGIRGGRILHCVSTDDGCTFGEPTDISRMTLPYYRNAFALGPGHGICTPDGTLVFPIWMVPKCYEQVITSHVPSCISTLYSRDNGVSFQMGEIMIQSEAVPSPNETEIALTSDGRIYLNARINRHCRAISYSKNGYSGWSPLTPDASLTDPCCFGSVVSITHNAKHALLFSNCSTESERKNVTVRISLDNGKTWTVKAVLNAQKGGYVESAFDKTRGYVYVLYETDYGKTCRLVTIPADELIP